MEDIKKNILDILNTRFSLNVTEGQFGFSVFNPAFGMDARNFVDLIFCIEKHYGIKFSPEILGRKDFCTLNILINETFNLISCGVLPDTL